MKKAFLLPFFYLLLFNAHAQLVQERIYRGSTLRKGFSTSTLAKQGTVFLSGVITAAPYYQALHFMVKPNLDTLWTRKGPPLTDGGIAVQQMASNNLVFAGSVDEPIVQSNSNIVLENLDRSGTQLWRKDINFGSFDYSFALQIMPDKDLVVAGYGCTSYQYSRFAITRFDSLGNAIRWQKDYHGNVGDLPVDMKLTKNGNLIVFGVTVLIDANPNLNRDHLKFLIINQNGDSVLGAMPVIIAPDRDEQVFYPYNSITSLSDGGYLVTGIADTTVNSSRKMLGFVAKLNSNLQPVWHYVQRGKLTGDFFYTKTRELADGSLLALGFGANNQFYLTRFSATGSLLNTYTFTSNLASQVKAVTLEYLPSDSTFIIGGEATVTPYPNYTSAFYLAKVKLPSSIPQVLGERPEIPLQEEMLGQSYPNPATKTAIIPFNLPKSYKQAAIQIRDITGSEIGSYHIEKHSNILEVSLSNLSNGLYTYTLLVDGKPVAVKKLSVIK